MIARLPFRRPADLPAAVAAVAEAALRHAVVAIPTETFYGLAVVPHDAVAVARLFAAKGRPAEKALPVVAANLEQVDSLVVLPRRLAERLAKVWPAPLTVVLPRRAAVAWQAETLAVRIPAHPLLRLLLARLGPLTATSANPSGTPPPTLPEQVERTLGEGVELLLDGGVTPGGAPSTLVDFSVSPPILLRQGKFQVPVEWGVKLG